MKVLTPKTLVTIFEFEVLCYSPLPLAPLSSLPSPLSSPAPPPPPFTPPLPILLFLLLLFLVLFYTHMVLPRDTGSLINSFCTLYQDLISDMSQYP